MLALSDQTPIRRKFFSGGRLRKLGSREPNGRLQRPTTRREREEPVMAVGLAQPHRQGRETRLAGYALGRLFLAGPESGIDKPQFAALERYIVIAVRYKRDVVDSKISLPSVMNEALGRSNWEPDDEAVFD